MAGLGIAIWTALRSVAGIGTAIDNHKMKNYSYKIDEKGNATWIDREGKQYVNGEKLVSKVAYKPNGDSYLQQVGQHSGKIYIDPHQNYLERERRENEERKQEAIAEGKLAYGKYDIDWNKKITTEISTGRPIAKLQGREDGTYWKYYAREAKPKYKGQCYLASDYQIDTPVQITQDEYDKLKIYGGTHYAHDYNRYKYDWKHDYELPRPKPLVAKEDLPKVPGCD